MNERTASAGILPILLDRWSPRSFDGTALPEADLDLILEAARWAPSAFNYQPWTFICALRGDANWDRFLSLLIPFNQAWAREAGALVFIVSDRQMRGPDGSAPHPTSSFDAGAAWMAMALQATAMGYHAHGMSGIDYAGGPGELGIPDDYKLEAAVAIGRRAPADRLPEGLREREAPSDRNPLGEIARRGGFTAGG